MKKSTLSSLALYLLVSRAPLKRRLLMSAVKRSSKASGVFLVYRIVLRLVRFQDRKEITVFAKEAVVETH
jgi:hypothetical protein